MAETHLDIRAEEIGALAAKSRYASLAAQLVYDGNLIDDTERINCTLFLMQIAEDLSARAADLADKLAFALLQARA